MIALPMEMAHIEPDKLPNNGLPSKIDTQNILMLLIEKESRQIETCRLFCSRSYIMKISAKKPFKSCRSARF